MGAGLEAGLGLAATSLLSLVIGLAGVVWGRRRRGREQGEDFTEIEQMLQDNLRGSIGERMEVARGEMRLRRLEMEKMVGVVRKEEAAALAEVEERHRREREEVEARYQAEVERVSQECTQEVEAIVASLRKTKLVLTEGEEVPAEVVEQGRGELECPVCLEAMRPPRRIWQCSDGHPVCEFCRKKPQVTCCPTCRKFLVGRSTIAEKLARALYQGEAEEEGEEGKEGERITLTGYQEVKPGVGDT